MFQSAFLCKSSSLAKQAAKRVRVLHTLSRSYTTCNNSPLIHTVHAYQIYSKRGLLSRARKSPDKSMTAEQCELNAEISSDPDTPSSSPSSSSNPGLTNNQNTNPSSKSSHPVETSTVAIKDDHTLMSGFDSEEEDIQLTLMEDVVIDDFLIDPHNNPKFQAMLNQWTGRPDGCQLMYRILQRPRHCAVLEKLINEGSNNPDTLPGDPKSRSPLMYAAEYGNVAALELLLKNEHVHKKRNRCEQVTGKSALLFALLGNHRKAVRVLLQNGCDDSIADRKGHNIYQICVVNPGLLSMLEYILRHSSFDPNNIRGVVNPPSTALHTAASIGNIEAMRILLADERTYIDQKNAPGYTPLMWTVMKKKLEAAHFLIDHGCDVSIRDDGGGNILHQCAPDPNMNGLMERILQDDMIDINDQDFGNGGQTALHVAILKSNFDAVKLLLNDERIDKNQSDVDGNTPLIYASMLGFEDLVHEMIHVHGCDQTPENIYGHTSEDMAQLITK